MTLKIERPPPPLPAAEAVAAELRPKANDAGLQGGATFRQRDFYGIRLSGAWAGFLRVVALWREKVLTRVCSCPLYLPEPAFTGEYQAWLLAKGPDCDQVWTNFIHVYSPLCQSAARKARKRSVDSRSNLPDEEDVCEEAWKRLLGKLERVFRGIDPERGSQAGYLFKVMLNDARTYLREIHSEPQPARPAGAGPDEPPLPIADPATVDIEAALADRHLLERILRDFRAYCEAHPRGWDEWAFFQAAFIEETTTEELCALYAILPANVHTRKLRVLQDLRAMLRESGLL